MALSKELADLQAQKKAVEAQLATLKTSSDKSTGAVKEADALKAQLSSLNQQKATLETRLAEQEKVLKSEKLKSEIAQNQLEDAKKVIASQESLLALQKNNVGSEKDKSGALVTQLAAAGKETEELKKQLAQLQTQKASLEEQQKTQSASLATLTAENQKLKESQAASAKATKEPQRMKIDKTAAKDTLTSYAIGTWYGDAAGREKSKLHGLNKKLDLNAFMQGFNDKVNNKLQMTPAALSKELVALDQVQKKQFVAMQSENEKQSKAIMTKAANEKGAKRLPEGAIYRVIQQGEAPLITAQNEIIAEIDEVLGTGKVMSSKEVRASRVKDLPPLFQTVVKKLGLGGEAKIHIPAKQAYGEEGVPGFVPPGTVSIITIKIIGIK
ncbi:FKBP-type peptidyl-prolyl cis-trans isomerase N-terminal domain-containing protein [Leclercia sp. LSNIH1]|uniref:FKBP-type peptidyl-prolyl cis-trans isomerase N-terminal domain-containing protein n=1 Tax=Leclercia sp. LSNIH1 TaxID=1920114 RepID=UPI0011132AE9|nr:FKBP-type peptidyl-prolyl cis-trans isomerase N-terminal domain-containing protein [Leclercia sp. LSNIH1]